MNSLFGGYIASSSAFSLRDGDGANLNGFVTIEFLGPGSAMAVLEPDTTALSGLAGLALLDARRQQRVAV